MSVGDRQCSPDIDAEVDATLYGISTCTPSGGVNPVEVNCPILTGLGC